MRRAIRIDPFARVVREMKFANDGELAQLLGTNVQTAGRFPNGDNILVGRTDGLTRECFSVGGSVPRSGTGLIIGRKDEAGYRRSAVSSVDTILPLVRFSTISDSECDTPQSETSGTVGKCPDREH
jgi:hypothetical protein